MTASRSQGAGWLLPVKSTLERVLTSGPARVAGRWHRRSERLVLAYHNVIPSGVSPPPGDASLHLALDAFRHQLDDLLVTGDVVSLESLLEAPAGARRIAITFDDAYAGALALGVPEVLARGLPVTIFVAPSLLGHGVPWWDRLAHQGLLSASRRQDALTKLQGKHTQVMRGDDGDAAPSLRATCAIGAAADLIAAARNPGIAIAGHSMTHPALPMLEHGELASELADSAAWLRDACPGAWRPWIAYPYGLTDDAVARAAESAGYTAGFEVSGGWHRTPADRMRIPRFNVPAGMSRRGFEIRINGVLKE